uniref:Uncharacterized protein n=1 Tax=Anopheles atroparvus TaxID=41427 RepID=A0A182IJ41_ANOAO
MRAMIAPRRSMSSFSCFASSSCSSSRSRLASRIFYKVVAYLIRVGGIDAVQCVVGTGQPAGQGEKQHRDVADVVDVRAELGGVVWAHLLRHL